MTTPAGPEIPREIIAAWDFGSARFERILGGLINQTYAVIEVDRPRAVLQKLHRIFSGSVNRDIDAITTHLAARGLETPRVLATEAGLLWHEAADGSVWRALTFIAGETLHRVDSPARARAAGTLVGQFHRAVADLRHDFHFSRAGVHDTPAFLARLRERAGRVAADDTEREAGELGRAILRAAADLPPLGDLPLRICHGDLKISNIMFRGPAAVCLIDLDTLGVQTIAYEMGDALRSWCNPLGEDALDPAADRAILDAALAGYLGEAGDLLSAAEIASIVPGMRTVCVELAARFCIDIFDDDYFGWDPSRFPSRRAHNLARARGQLALAATVPS